jgi:membrane-associated phospholipid phosphatase
VRPLARPTLGLALSLAVFSAIALALHARSFVRADAEAEATLHGHSEAAVDAVMRAASAVGGAPGLWVVLATAVLLFLLRRRLGAALFLAVSTVGAGVIDERVKAAFHRARPAADIAGYSFPSGHAMGATAFAAALVVLAWRTRHRLAVLATAVVVVALVDTSRVQLGVHYPSDVIAGSALALAWIAALLLLRDLRPRRTDIVDPFARASEVGDPGFEPGTSALSERRSNQLS